jgi:hypothetical protein
MGARGEVSAHNSFAGGTERCVWTRRLCGVVAKLVLVERSFWMVSDVIVESKTVRRGAYLQWLCVSRLLCLLCLMPFMSFMSFVSHMPSVFCVSCRLPLGLPLGGSLFNF